MSSLEQLRRGLHRSWHGLAEGWQHLRERATHALTPFSAARQHGEVETVADQAMLEGSRWGLLAADVEEKTDSVVVRLEAPGMEAEDFDISVDDNYLVVRGEKRARREQSKGRFYILECAYGSFERALQLPTRVEESGARAKYKRGVLTITLPKHAHAQRRRINISSG
jgi:HSP20 family protein